jgi:hypothetical protein
MHTSYAMPHEHTRYSLATSSCIRALVHARTRACWACRTERARRVSVGPRLWVQAENQGARREARGSDLVAMHIVD